MSKCLEYVRSELELSDDCLTTHDRVMLKQVEKELKRLEAIDNANPSEALECLENIEADLTGLPKHVTEYDDGFDNYLEDIWYNINAIKQALIKAQEQEKALEIIINKRVDVYALIIAYDSEDYNNMIKHTYELTQEEFDLLKDFLKEVF